jgi:purine catabolism regulator
MPDVSSTAPADVRLWVALDVHKHSIVRRRCRRRVGRRGCGGSRAASARSAGLIDRLGGADASVAVLSGTGEVEIAVGGAPIEALGRAAAGAAPRTFECELGEWHAVLAPVAGHADAPRWLAVAIRRGGFALRLARPAVEATTPLLGAMGRLRDVVVIQEAAAKGALLEELLEPADPRDVPGLAARAAAFGVDFSLPARVVVVRNRSSREDDVSVLAHELGEVLAGVPAPYLLTRRAACVVALVQAEEAPLRAALEELTATQRDAAVGIGRPLTGAAAVPHSLRDGELAVEPGACDEDQRILAFEEFDLATLLLSEARPEWLGPKVQEIIAVLRSRPTMHDALKAWFEHDLDTAAAAAALHLHPNSLRYRLSRLEEALGRTLRRPSTIANLHIALLADQADGGHHPPDPATPEPR